MANFNTHLSVAFVASGVGALVLYKAGILSGIEFLLCTVVGTVGGLLPDIDLDHSIPAKIGFNALALLSAFLMVMYWSSQLALLSLMVVWLLTYLIMRYGVFNLFSSLTVHRGVVHSLPYLAIVALLLVDINFYLFKYTAILSWAVGLFLFVGSLIHLVLDEIYSVNVFGLKLKKSFGTAFKLFEMQRMGLYITLYLIVIALVIFSPPFTLFWQTLTDPISWLILKKNLLPIGINLQRF